MKITLVNVKQVASLKGLAVSKQSQRYYICRGYNPVADFHYISQVNTFLENYVAPVDTQVEEVEGVEEVKEVAEIPCSSEPLYLDSYAERYGTTLNSTYPDLRSVESELSLKSIESNEIEPAPSTDPPLVWKDELYYWRDSQLVALKEKDAVREAFRRFGVLAKQVEESFYGEPGIRCSIPQRYRDLAILSFPDEIMIGDSVTSSKLDEDLWGVVVGFGTFHDENSIIRETVKIKMKGNFDASATYSLLKEDTYQLSDAKTIIVNKSLLSGKLCNFTYRGLKLKADIFTEAIAEAGEISNVTPANARFFGTRNLIVNVPFPVTPSTAERLKDFNCRATDFFSENDAIAYLDRHSSRCV